MAAGVTDRLWEMVDVVDVLDAFEVKRKRLPKVTFDVERWRIGEGYYVTVTMPGSEPEKITDTFATEARQDAGLKMNRSYGCPIGNERTTPPIEGHLNDRR